MEPGGWFYFYGRVSPCGATHFAHGGKVGKAPFKGEMFRFISPLKIPLFSDKKEDCGPLF